MTTSDKNLLELDMHTNGRSIRNLGLENKTKDEIINYITNEV